MMAIALHPRDRAASRRLDVRVLFPGVRLERVAYLGSATDPLLEALRAVYAPDVNPLGGTYDLVVVRDAVDPRRVHALVAADGCAYWESERHFGGTPRIQARQLLGAGFSQVAIHWHRPNFAARAEILPLDHEGALAWALAGGGSMRGAVRRRAMGALQGLGLLETWIPAWSVLARSRPSGDAFATWLHSRCPTALHSVPTLLWRTPRFETSSHCLGFAFEASDRKPRVVVKMPRRTGTFLAREAENLQRVQALHPNGFTSVPRRVAWEVWGDTPVLVQSALPGEPLSPRRVRRAPESCVRSMSEWLDSLHRVSRRDAWSAERRDALVEAPLRTLLECGGKIAELAARTCVPQNFRVPLVFEHGDLGSSNVLQAPDGSLGVVDWELGEAAGLPAVDWFYFLAYVAGARAAARTPAQHVRAVRSAVLDAAGWARPWIAADAARLKLAPAMLPVLFTLTWARVVAGIAARHGGHLADGDPAAARALALWRLALEEGDGLAHL